MVEGELTEATCKLCQRALAAGIVEVGEPMELGRQRARRVAQLDAPSELR